MSTPTTSYIVRRNWRRKTPMPRQSPCAWRKLTLYPTVWSLSQAQVSASRVVLCCVTPTVTPSVLFNASAPRGRHERSNGDGEKEYYVHRDSTPTHSYMKFLYKYPQRAYP